MSNLVYDRLISISVGKSRKVTQWEQRQLSISDLYQLFGTPRRSSETQAEYMAMSKSQQDDLKDVGGFVGGSLNGPRRKKRMLPGGILSPLTLITSRRGRRRQ